MSVLVYVEHVEGELKKSALEAVAYGKAIADQTGTTLAVLAIGEISNENLSPLGSLGAEKILVAPNPQYSSFNEQSYSHAVAEAARKENAEVIVLSQSTQSKGIAPRVSIKLQAGLVSGATSLPETISGKFIIKKPCFSGKAISEVEILSAQKVITLSPNSFSVKETQSKEAIVEVFDPATDENNFRLQVKEIRQPAGTIALPEAEIVVSGGRGLKGPENWNLVENLAEVLGAATACSKPVSDAGWRPHEEHVGQTGITISPNLYIAIAISGAIQHVAGISSSKTIVAVNKDAEAPIFKIADYGIVGDAFEVIPALTEAFKRYKANG